MKLITLKCPNCGATLEIENGLDMFFCKYCGHQIMLTNLSREVIRAKTKMIRMEHEEHILNKKHAQERYKIESENKNEKHSVLMVFGWFAPLLLIVGVIMVVGNAGVKKQEAALQATLAEVIVDIQNGDYDSATIKANTLYWDSDFTREGKEKWDSTRRAVLIEIEQAKKDNGLPVEEEEKGLLGWFD